MRAVFSSQGSRRIDAQGQLTGGAGCVLVLRVDPDDVLVHLQDRTRPRPVVAELAFPARRREVEPRGAQMVAQLAGSLGQRRQRESSGQANTSNAIDGEANPPAAGFGPTSYKSIRSRSGNRLTVQG